MTPPGTTDTGPPPAELDPHRWRALAVCLTTLFLPVLDLTIVNVALPAIGESTGAQPSQLLWVVSGYAIAFGMVPIIGGRLGDDRGRRTMMLVGIVAFVLTSALVGLAPTTPVLIVGRILQGLAGGLINPQVSGVVQQLFPRGERARAFGALGTAIGTATAVGPVVGGAVISIGGPEWGWRLAFLVNVPIGVVAFVLCRAWVPATPVAAGPGGRQGRHPPLDVWGALILGVGLFCVLFPAVEYDAVRDLRITLIWVPAAAILIGFVAWERGPAAARGYPLINIRLFAIRSYTDGITIALVFLGAFTGTPLVLALFLQDGVGYTALQSGLAATAFASGAALGAPLAGRAIGRHGRTVLIATIGLFCLGAAGSVLLVLTFLGSVPPDRIGWLLAPALFVAGLGAGGVTTPNQALSLAEIDTRGGSTAGGMLQTAQRVGSAIGTAAMSAVFYAQIRGDGDLTGAARIDAYGHAYAMALIAGLGFAVLALGFAVRDARRQRRHW